MEKSEKEATKSPIREKVNDSVDGNLPPTANDADSENDVREGCDSSSREDVLKSAHDDAEKKIDQEGCIAHAEKSYIDEETLVVPEVQSVVIISADTGETIVEGLEKCNTSFGVESYNTKPLEKVKISEVKVSETEPRDNSALIPVTTNHGDKERSSISDLTTACMSKESRVAEWLDADGASSSSLFSQFHEHPSSKVQPPNRKSHNLSISELRKKLACCPVCQTHHTNHKTANNCLARHGKRQCWLCLDVLSSKKDDFYRHCTEFHSITKNGDIVGCPFCGKFFDFRQGLNQHIVKIHFAESISDVDAVASLSPTTLVDIFTGKPRSSCSTETEFQQQAQQIVSNERIGDSEALDAKTIEDILIATVNNNGCTNLNNRIFSPANGTNDQPVLRGMQEPEISTESAIHSQYHPRLNNASENGTNISAEVVPLPNLPRPSVITQSFNLNPVQKMSVPPEQTLSSLMSGDIESGLSLGFGSLSQNPLQTDDIFVSAANEVVVVENPTVQKYADLFRSYSKTPSLPMVVTSDPEKFEQSFPNQLLNKELPQVDLSNVEKRDSAIPFEQVITRVNRNISQHEFSHAAVGIDQGNAYGCCSTPTSSLPTTGTDTLPTLDGQGSCLTDLDKSYHSSFEGLMKYSTDNLIATSSSNQTNYYTPPSSYTSGRFESTGNCINPEIGMTNCLTLNCSDKCGIKRRILLKALRDEHLFKKPAFHTNPGLQPQSSLMHKTTMNSDPGFIEDFFPKDPYSTSQLRYQPNEDPGIFFEQYVKQDKSRQENPTKLLDLTRIPGVDPGLNNSNFSSWNIPVSSVNETTVPHSSCARHDSLGESENAANAIQAEYSNALPLQLPVHNWQASAPPVTRPQQQQQQQQQQQRSNSGYFRGRKPPNPAFWDGLRARLMMSQRMGNLHYRGRNPNNFMNPAAPLLRNKSQPGGLENVVVQNPFEESDMSTFRNPVGAWPNISHQAIGLRGAIGDAIRFRAPGRENFVSTRGFQKRSPFPNISPVMRDTATPSEAQNLGSLKLYGTQTFGNPGATTSTYTSTFMQQTMPGDEGSFQEDGSLYNQTSPVLTHLLHPQDQQKATMASPQDSMKCLSHPAYFTPRYNIPPHS